MNSLNVEQIQEIIPHRHPFLLIDKIEDYGSTYTYAGSTELEIKNNQIEIGLGLYMKEKYIEYKKLIDNIKDKKGE